MIFELSRDYKRAFELIKKGDRILGWQAHSEGCKSSIEAWLVEVGQERHIAFSTGDYFGRVGSSNSDFFVEYCDRLNVEFYLPLPDNMLVISAEKVEEIATKVLLKR